MERFWSKVKKTESCWLWTATKNHRGYGRFQYEGRLWLPHRISWRLHYGDIPNDTCVCHKCDVRLCVNPSHLFLGTHQDNAIDRERKGRGVHLRGEDVFLSKLTDVEIIEIREKYSTGEHSFSSLGRDYNMHYSSIADIVRRHTWKHI